MTLVLGVDGCPGGWCCVPIRIGDGDPEVLPSTVVGCFGEALAMPAEIICVDIPIGLSCGTRRRQCDGLARSMLGAKRSSVFDPPCRHALPRFDHSDASNANEMCTTRGLSIQAFGIMPKIREVDAAMYPHLQDRVREIHPELCFSAVNGGAPIASKKRYVAGRIDRWNTLKHYLRGLPAGPPKPSDLAARCEPDDYIDALAAAWAAVCILHKEARHIPAKPPTDERGLRMEMWYPAPTRWVRRGQAARRR